MSTVGLLTHSTIGVSEHAVPIVGFSKHRIQVQANWMIHAPVKSNLLTKACYLFIQYHMATHNLDTTFKISVSKT